MDFEQCEIRANHYGPFLPFLWKWDMVAQVTGVKGSYIVARTRKFSPTHDNLYWLYENAFEWELLNKLTDHLIRTGWKLIPGAGTHWYSRKFQRPIALYQPDLDPSNPYTLGDEAKWQRKIQKAADEYKKRKDTLSAHKLALYLMQLGLALERNHEFDNAYKQYHEAALLFDVIHADEDVAMAHRWEKRVSMRLRGIIDVAAYESERKFFREKYARSIL